MAACSAHGPISRRRSTTQDGGPRSTIHGADGAVGYFDERGVSMRRFFLASPLKFQPVVTSTFFSQPLPIDSARVPRASGVDYRAPAGAPVVALSDGVVVSAAMSGGSGGWSICASERLRIRVSPSVVDRRARRSARASGQLIGRVGSTGLATGPHLDYRLKKNGAFINPLTAHRSMPPADRFPLREWPSSTPCAIARLDAFSTPAVARASNPSS